MFEAWGRFVYRRRWATLAISAALLGLSIFGLLRGGTLTSGNSGTSGLEASRANRLINQQLGSGQPAGSSFLLVFSSDSRSVTDPAFRAAVESALAPIQHDPRVTGIQSPYNMPTADLSQPFISRDGHQALVHVSLKDTRNRAVS